MVRRKVHALEVVVIGFHLRPHAHRVAQRRKHSDNLVQRARDRMLGAREPPRSWQSDVDGLSLQRRIRRTRSQSRIQQPLHHRLQRVEAHA